MSAQQGRQSGEPSGPIRSRGADSFARAVAELSVTLLSPEAVRARQKLAEEKPLR